MARVGKESLLVGERRRMDKDACLSLVIIVVIIIAGVCGIIFLNGPHSSCTDKGFDYSDGGKTAKPGFIVCCNRSYENNIRTYNDTCVGVRK